MIRKNEKYTQCLQEVLPCRIIGNHVRFMNGTATVNVFEPDWGLWLAIGFTEKAGFGSGSFFYMPESLVRRPAESLAWTDSGLLFLFICITETRLCAFFNATAFFVTEKTGG